MNYETTPPMEMTIDVEYVRERNSYRYIKYLRNIMSLCGVCAQSVLDVGSGGVDMLSFLDSKNKCSIDLDSPLIAEGITSIKDDFIKHNFVQKFDLVSCFQVLEHIDNDDIDIFCKKLLDLGKILIISVPYKWPYKKNNPSGHLQDPVDENKVYSWFKKEPIFSQLIKDRQRMRLINIYNNTLADEQIKRMNCGCFNDFFNNISHCFPSENSTLGSLLELI